jgi:nucleotide-binding universal stress UspA family protein
VRSAALAALKVPRAVVLFAMFEEGQPTASILRARALSRVLEAELHVLRVLPEYTRVNAVFPQNNSMDALQAVERAFRTKTHTRLWLRECLGDDESAVDHIAIVHGDFVDMATQQAAKHDTVLIVIPPCAGNIGHTVTSLATTSGVPVLVAREATKDETIIAATDLQDTAYPVLRQAAKLGQQLDASVIALHNVNPMPVLVGTGMAWPITVYPSNPVCEARSARLTQISQKLPGDAHPVIRNEMNAADAILGEAREHDADLVIVGTRRRRNWFDRLVAGNVAAQVVNRAKRSVLVTPLGDAKSGVILPFGHS